MDVTTIVTLFFDGPGPWAALAVILLFLQWDAARHEERGVRQSLDLLAVAFEGFVKDFHVHDARSERIQETLAVLASRREMK